MKSKKNSLTAHRITSDWKLKSDTLALPIAVGSQTGPVIRKQVKEELDKFGCKDNWEILFTTDGAAAARSARASGRHLNIGLNVVYDGDCVDHQLHLLVEESIDGLPQLKSALKKVREYVTSLNQSHLAKQELMASRVLNKRTIFCVIRH